MTELSLRPGMGEIVAGLIAGMMSHAPTIGEFGKGLGDDAAALTIVGEDPAPISDDPIMAHDAIETNGDNISRTVMMLEIHR